MPRLLIASLMLSLAGLLLAGSVYAQLTHSGSATGVINAPAAAPTPTSHAQGDVDCSGGAIPVTAVDALKVLRHIAGLSVSQPPYCDKIGTGGPPLQGDVDCSGAVLATDALKILRRIAGLSVSRPQTCPEIGT